MSIVQQGSRFLFIGGCLVLVDWGVFVLLTAVGVDTSVANVCGRVVGALLGFVANGRITFGSPGAPRLGRRHFGRFVLLWLAMTLLSTWLVSGVAAQLSLQMAWLGKPLVEGVLASVSFIVSRHWVYR